MKTLFSGRSDMPFAMLLLAPSLILLGARGSPMISNIEISFLRLPLNPRISAVFVGLDNYIRILGDAAFWHSLWMTFWYTALVVIGSTVLGLAVAIFFNREFRLRKTARSLVILSYVTPSISLVFARKYMFNNGYGIVNYLGVDLLHLYDQAPLWFDNPNSSFVLVVLFAIWRYFPYAFISFWRFYRPLINPCMKRRKWTARMPGSVFGSSRCPRLCRCWPRWSRFAPSGCSTCLLTSTC